MRRRLKRLLNLFQICGIRPFALLLYIFMVKYCNYYIINKYVLLYNYDELSQQLRAGPDQQKGPDFEQQQWAESTQ